MHIVITAGGTREYIDSVRFISNASSGRMGYALARAAISAGHKTTLITAAKGLREPSGAKMIRAETAGQMFDEVKRVFSDCDCLVMAAAVSDYTPTRTIKSKLKKSDENITLELKPTVDIARWAGMHKKPCQLVVGFALEDSELHRRAEQKMLDKKLDIIVANAPEAISAKHSQVDIKRLHGEWLRLGKCAKSKSAGKILEIVEQTLQARK